MSEVKNTESNPLLTGIILAAGASTRFGSPKQLVEIDGKTMIAGAVHRAMSQCDAGVIVVAGANYGAMAPILNSLPVQVVRNRQWRDGMGSSIGAGMAGVPGRSAGVLLMLCDQPAVTVADLQRMTKIWREAPAQIATARYAESLGVPAIFPQTYWPQLRDLKNDEGAKRIIRIAKAVSVVDMPAAARDIDTLEDFAEFGNNASS